MLWQFSFLREGALAPPLFRGGLDPELAPVRRQGACSEYAPTAHVRLKDGSIVDTQSGSDAVLLLPDGSFRSYSVGGLPKAYTAHGTDSTFKERMTDAKEILLQSVFWSLTAALTPGGHHVRIYLESEGRITTMLSKKDNFVEFLEPGIMCRDVSGDASPEDAPLVQCGPDIGEVTFWPRDLGDPPVGGSAKLTTIRPRDPNITMNDAGVYALTWDNRPATPDYGPGGGYDSIALSDTFGLAFSVDGLNWTVYSSAMKIEALPPWSSPTAPGTRASNFTGKLRHVVPVFITNDRLRIYFTAETVSECLGNCPGLDLPITSCSLGTAISN